MSHNPYESPEYRSNPERSTYGLDYQNPAYYQAPEAPQPPPDPYANTYRPGSPDYTQSQSYTGPESYQSYHAQMEAQATSQQQQSQSEPGRGARRGLAGIGTLVIAAISWLAKLKGLVFLLKFGTAGFSAIITAAFYAVAFGWPFAIGLVVSLFIHEMGHALVMKLKGIPVGSLIFIPMLGAAVTMKRMPQNVKDEAEVAIAGPIAGALAASVCLIVAQVQPGGIWGPLAYFGFFINLFNLIPIVPFDGGRVLAAIDRRIWILGFVGLLAYQIWSWLNGHFYLWLLIFVIFGAMQLWSRGIGSQSAEGEAYYAVPVRSRVLLTLLYFGLAAVLFMGMTISHDLLPISY